MISYRFKLCDSLEKVFPDRKPEAMREKEGVSIFYGERFSFQIAYYVDCFGVDLLEEELQFTVHLPKGLRAVCRKVGLAPSGFPCNGEYDEDYITTKPGLFPDILEEMSEMTARAVHGQWRAVWVELTADKDCEPGPAFVEVTVSAGNQGYVWRERFCLQVLSGRLPEQTLIHTELFHADCLADYYRVEVFSERHWEIVEHFMRVAGERGMNMILTPLFTPCFDTAVGGERTTVQLVDVVRTSKGYEFGFGKLHRFIELARRCGMKYFEMAPLFTQWGAKAAPKIAAVVDGKTERIFGWETDASGDEYMEFLHNFLPHLLKFLQKEGVLLDTWFHVSDEPTRGNLESYQKAYDCMKTCLPGCRLMDALSDYEFYELGIVKHPVVSSNHIEPFLQAGVSNLWTYYCCVQGVDVSNRFFAMPSYRNRILGIQLYLYRMQGFLHWGYNFYNTRYSKKQIDPYVVTDCGECFPSGDPFLVYPGEDGKPVLSIRLMVLEEAMQDLRALSWLESLSSRSFVEQLIDQCGGRCITFRQYPRNAGFLLKLRREVNRCINNILCHLDESVVQ